MKTKNSVLVWFRSCYYSKLSKKWLLAKDTNDVISFSSLCKNGVYYQHIKLAKYTSCNKHIMIELFEELHVILN